MQNADRLALYKWYSKMIHYKTNNDVFSTTNFTYSLSGAVKWIQLIGTSGTEVEVVGNFDVVPRSATVQFPATGTWYDNSSGETLEITNPTYQVTLQPGEYHLYSNAPLKEYMYPR
jgi:hypothetical protein